MKIVMANVEGKHKRLPTLSGNAPEAKTYMATKNTLPKVTTTKLPTQESERK